MFKVTLVACIEGNPFKAWHGSTGEDDTEHVPNDVWQDQSHDYADLAAAKEFIQGLHSEVTTHALLWDEDGETVLYNKDAGDDLEAADSGVVPASLAPLEDTSVVVPEAPTLMEAQ